VSVLSQCDDDQTCGDYGELYTTLQQIGKGAFGYVKMAFRNEDGLLVCISLNQNVLFSTTLQENVHFVIVIMFLTHGIRTGI
jgi:PAS domain-containing serine/threonine kinase